MIRRATRGVWKKQPIVWVVCGWLMLAATISVWAQDEQAVNQETAGQSGNRQPPLGIMALGNRMAELELQLESVSIPERDAAEQEILGFGSSALDFLPALTGTMSTDLRERLIRIRKNLELEVVKSIIQPAQVELAGAQTIRSVLDQIIAQSGNQVVLPEGLIDETAQVQTDWGRLPFWEALDRTQSAYQLEIDRFGGAAGQLAMTRIRPRQPVAGMKPADPLVAYANTLRLEITRMEVVRNFLAPEQSGTIVDLAVRWEPRLKPIAFDLKYSSLEIIDEFDVAIPVDNPERMFSALVQPEIPEVECRLRLPVLERQIESIKSLSGTFETVLTGRMETFEFTNLDAAAEGTALQKADATVTFAGRGKIDDLETLRVALSYAQENNALESHRSWAFRNPVFLQTREGQRIEPIGYETYQQTNESLGIQYLFIEIPAGAKLIYQTPAAIVKLEIPFRFLGIPLP